MRAALVLSMLFTTVFANPSLAFSDMERQLIKLFRQAIVKVDVSGEHPQLDSTGQDICKSQGMGFLISRTHVISAKHVTDVDSKCGRRILISSAATSFEAITDVVMTHGDIILLKLRDASAPRPLCSLAVADKNVYDQSVVRFAMPAALVDPEPLMTEVGELGQFNPNVRFSPAPVHPGDSGGPIVHMFSVIGITKEKLTLLDGYGIMIPVDPIVTLLKNANFRSDDSTCNPLLMSASGFQVTFNSDVLKQSELRAGLETAIVGMSYAYRNTDRLRGITAGAEQPSFTDHITIPGVGTIELPQLSRPVGGAVASSIEPDFAEIQTSPDGQGVSVVLGRKYPEIAPELLGDSLKSQMWNSFVQSLSGRQ